MMAWLKTRFAGVVRPLTALVLLAIATSASAATLQIAEIMAGPARDWDGSGTFSSRDDEWVEVRNVSGGMLDLGGFLLTDGDTIPRYALSGSLAAGDRFVVYGKASFDWEHATGFPAFGLSLGNSGDAVMLWHVDGADTTLVDAYTYKSHEAAADRSVGRINDDGPWSLFDGLDPYTGTLQPGSTGCSPTPGEPNACGATESHASTWGGLKRRFRSP
jgi:hypothetical protein